MSAWAGGPGDLDDRQRAGIRRALAKWRQQRFLLESQAPDPGMPPAEPTGPWAAGVPGGAPTDRAAAGGPAGDRGPTEDAATDCSTATDPASASATAQAGDPASASATAQAGGGSRPPGDRGDPFGDRVIGLDIEIVDVELLHPGRPGVLDVVAEMDGRLAHAVFALRRPGDEVRVVGAVEDPALGFVEDPDGMAVLVDALRDAEAARLLLHAVAGSGIDRAPEPIGSTRQHPGGVVALVADGPDATILAIDRRFMLSVFPWLRRGPHPGTTVLAGLDEAGFNHLAAPVALWRRAGRDLGAVQEFLTGASGGWALALASLRDLFAAGVDPDAAGGDFASEALALGTMAARMHLALDRAFGRRAGEPRAWAGEAERAAAGAPLSEAARSALDALCATELRPPAIRVHGDFHLGRTERTDHGWVLTDTMPGGTEEGSDDPVYRSPLCDVACFCASLRRAARTASAEQSQGTDVGQVLRLASAWEARNRQAFLAAYLATPGIGGLVPANRELSAALVTCFEILADVVRPAPAGLLG